MAKTDEVLFITGSMFSKKSKILMDFIKEAHDEPKCKYLVFKPTSDTRDGLFVKSRVYNEVIPAPAWDQKYDDMKTIFNYTVAGFSLTNPHDDKIIFIDEGHFISLYDMQFIVETCKKYKIGLVVAGLLTTFKLDYFETGKWLADNFEHSFLHGNCNGCKKDNAFHNVLFENDEIVKDGDVNRPGDLEYKVFCDDCLKELQK